MKIETAAFIRYDLCHRSKQGQLLSALREVYDDEGERHGERVLGGEQWARDKFTGDLTDLDDGFADFASTRTYIGFQPRHLIDIVTVAELADEQIEKIEESDSGSQYFIEQNGNLLTEIASEIPTVAPTDYNRQPVHFYVEPTEAQPVRDDDGDIDANLLRKFLENSRDELRGIYYETGHPQSLLNGEDLAAPQGTSFPWGRLTIFNLTAPPASEADFEPIWLRRLRPLREYLRTYLWLEHRRELLAELDRDTHGIDQLMRNASGETSQLEEVLKIEEELDEIRERWTDRYTKTVDEVADLRSRPPLHRPRQDDLEPVKIDEITEGVPVESLFDIYDRHIATQVEQVTSDLDRIGSKLDEVSSYIQDKIDVRGTRATINQQQTTKKLTWAVVFLTVVLVALEIIGLLWVT